MNEAAPMIAARNLTKVFRDFWYRPKVNAVRGVSFEVRRGEVFGLLGPNGSGKSTTIKMILGLLQPSSGSLLVLSRSPRDVRSKARLGYLPEETYLYPYLTSRETLDFYGRLFDLSARERRERSNQLLETIGLQHTANRLVGEFSKGMARRIGLAQALINDPELVLLDEPTSGLDPLGTRQVKDLILALANRGKTVLLSSHLLADVEDVCDRIAILYNGTIKAQGQIDELLEVRQHYRMTFPDLSAEKLEALLAAMEQIAGSRPAVDHPRRDLERFFIDVVEQARKETGEASGVRHSEGVAEYLSEQHAPPADARLKELLTEKALLPTAPAATPEAPAPDEAPKPPKELSAQARRKLEELLPTDADPHE